MNPQALLKQAVSAVIALAISLTAWTVFANFYTSKIARQVRIAKPMEFKTIEFPRFDTKSLIQNQKPINFNGFQSGRPSR